MKRYTVIISEEQRKLIQEALAEYETDNLNDGRLRALIERLANVPKSEREHPGIKHVLFS